MTTMTLRICKKINGQFALAKEFLEFGITRFIVVENYSAKINSLYKDLIQSA